MPEFHSVDRKPLATKWQSHKEAYDVVVIGSGYGGAISAARIATASWPGDKPTVCLLERGKEWLPKEFPYKVDQALKARYDPLFNPLGLYKFDGGADIVSFQGSGLGGTSLLNANVAYNPEDEVFAKNWPTAIQDSLASGELRKLFKRVIATLRAQKHPQGQSLSKVKALKQGAGGHADAPHFLNNITVNFDGQNPWGVAQRECINCGDCVTGCNVGAKNTLDTSYLKIAELGGAHIFPQIDVRHIEVDKTNGGYRVHFVRHTENDKTHKGTPGVLHARKGVIVSGGSIGSTEILLRSRKQGLALSQKLGRRWGGNADFFGIAYNSNLRTDVPGWGAFPETGRAKRIQPQPNPTPATMLVPGPTIVSTVRYNASGPFKKRVTVQDTSIPLAYVDLVRAGLAASIGIDTDAGDESEEFARRWRDTFAIDPQLEKGALNHTLFYLVMGADDQEGVIRLDLMGNAQIRWPKVGKQDVFDLENRLLKQHAKALGATFEEHPLWRFSPWRTPVTVHPLGGCPMGDDVDQGVVDDRGRVFRPNGDVYSGFYVTDGSIVPAPVGANPFLTISGLSERVAEGLIRDLGGAPRVVQDPTEI